MRWTAFYGGLLAVLYVALAFRVVTLRWRHGVGLGDGGHGDLARAIRVHGNFAEFVPLSLVLLGIIEANGLPAWGMHALGGGLLFSRLMHAQGLSRKAGTTVGRWLGAALTFSILTVAGAVAVYQSLNG